MGTGRPVSNFEASTTPQAPPPRPVANYQPDGSVVWTYEAAPKKDPTPPKTTDDFLKKGLSPDVTDQRLRDALAMKMRNQGIGRRSTFLGGFAEQSALGRY